jgi:hypothetical protein
MLYNKFYFGDNMGYLRNFFGRSSGGSCVTPVVNGGTGTTIVTNGRPSLTLPVFTTQLNSTIISPTISPTISRIVDKRLTDYPHSINTYAGCDSFTAACFVIAKYSLTEDIDYIKIELAGNYIGNLSIDVRFKDKRYIDEINTEANRTYYVNCCLRQYALPEYKDFYFQALHVAKHGTLKASINFIPKVNKFDELVQEIISFYVSNDYELPGDIGTFKSKYLTLNSLHTYYTVYVKNEEEAALLLLQISDLIDII